MLKEAQYLSITLPNHLADIPIRVVRGETSAILISYVENEDPMNVEEQKIDSVPTHSLIWNKGEYVSCNLNDIVRIEADGSYSIIHFVSQTAIVISYPLSVWNYLSQMQTKLSNKLLTLYYGKETLRQGI